jgi:polysaccharide biosynthesis transport protein
MASTPTAPNNNNELFGDLNLRDYLAIAKRRRFWIILPAVAVLIVTSIVVWRLPNTYRCQTTILIDPQKVPENYVKSVVTQNIADRISTIQEQVTSPVALKKLVDTMGLYPDLKKRLGEQEVLRIMQKAVAVEPVTSMGTQLSAFRITFKGRDPVEAAQVTNQIAALFIEENLKVREQQSYGTADFLENELQKTSQQLQEKENELAQTRSRYIEDLPGSEQFHVQQAESLRMELRSINDRISRDEQEKISLRSMMAATAPTLDLDLGSGNGGYQSQLETLQSKLSALLNRYGPDHPDVKRLQAEMDKLKAKQPDTASKTGVTAGAEGRTNHNPVVEAQIEKFDEDVAAQKENAARVQKEIDFHISKMQQSPIFLEKTAGITRDYDALRARYSQLLEKKLSADTASAMESRQKSERFVILDPAQVPDKPYSPNRILMVLAGVLGGLFVGVGTAALVEVGDESVLDGAQVEKILGRPVLSGIPEILTEQERWSVRVRLCAVSLATVVVSMALGFGLAHFSVQFL